MPSRRSAAAAAAPAGRLPPLHEHVAHLATKRNDKLEAGGAQALHAQGLRHCLRHTQTALFNVQGTLQQPGGRYPLLQAEAAAAGCKAAPTPTEFAGQLSSFH